MNIRNTIIGTLLAAGLFPLAACSGSSSPATPTVAATPSATTVSGTFELDGYALWNLSAAYNTLAEGHQEWADVTDGGQCNGKGGYSDIAAGMQVVLKDGSTTLDVANLGPGKFGPIQQHSDMATPQACIFAFTLHVPQGHKFYTVSVGRRGDRTYDYQQITTPGTLTYQIGN